jgi:hypothetical protein
MGLILTVWRILRCNPFCPGGYDPVPERGFPRKGYYSIKGNEVALDSDATDTQEEPSDADTATSPKRICEDYYLQGEEEQSEQPK